MLFLAAAAAAESWTLHDAVAHALAHNIEVRQEALDTASAGAALNEALGAFGPTLSGAASLSGQDDPQAPGASDDGAAWSLGLSQPLPTGGTLWLGGSQDQAFSQRIGPDASVYTFSGVTIEQPVLDGAWGAALYGVASARLDRAAAVLQERDARERLAVDVANAYWELVAARESTRLALRSVEIATSQLADTQERFDEGFAGSGDVLQLERALGVARQTQVVAEASEAAAQRALARRLGVPLEDTQDFTLVDRPDPPVVALDPAVVLAEARAHNATFLLASIAQEQARRDRGYARIGALPDLDLSASAGVATDSDPAGAFGALTAEPTATWSVGARLSVPLTGTRPALTQAALAYDRAELEAEAAWQDLVAQVQTALDAVRRDRERVTLAELTRKAAQAGLDADQELYREGRGSTRDVVRSLESLEAAQVQRLSAEIDLQASLLTLARLRGGVLVDLGVGAR
jgi:outer membrane protein